MKIAIADTDILSSFGKVGRVGLLQRLFPKIHISPAVHRELMKAEQAGLRWIASVQAAVESLALTKAQTKEVGHLVIAYPQLGIGEVETFVLAKAYRALCLTNDRQAKRVCHALGLQFLDLEEILRALKVKEIMTSQALEQLIVQIEDRDHTRIKAKNQILRD
ncbi:MAG: hypothetical protein C3F12_06360 [Candidatus Methylomirabilota bacterium]|nr:hypothetical protein [Candidatus Methylomirabilis sp.]NJD69641.1 hypothetical protein [candidate division NC10 bacterium]PWB46557.1 MAG: hypothetical protein C3F12_06360 [candidate division NC10 bacterium]